MVLVMELETIKEGVVVRQLNLKDEEGMGERASKMGKCNQFNKEFEDYLFHCEDKDCLVCPMLSSICKKCGYGSGLRK